MRVPLPEPRNVPALGAFLEGWRRVLRAPAVAVGTLAAMWLASRLLLVGMTASSRLTYWEMRPIAGLNAAAIHLLEQLVPNLMRILAPDVSLFLDAQVVPPVLLGALFIRAGVWMFLSGGILDRLARGRPIRTAAFFAASGVYCFRFIRLAVLAGTPCWALLHLERAYFEGNLIARGLVVLAVLPISLVSDFAKVRAVVEDRRSMIGAVTASIRFLRRRLWRIAALCFLNGLSALIVLRLQFQMVTSPVGGRVQIFLFSVVLLLLSTSARLAMLASEVVFFQGELAHAGYTAAPLPMWPESPAVEAIENLVSRSDYERTISRTASAIERADIPK